ncbi:MAG: hypothetical protein V4603_15250 [Pseudomonadota bacterium]
MVSWVALTVCWLSITDCAATPNPAPRQALPNYAVPVGTLGWSVLCGNANVAGDWNDASAFYDENGKVKDHQRFCDEMQTGSRIRSR